MSASDGRDKNKHINIFIVDFTIIIKRWEKKALWAQCYNWEGSFIWSKMENYLKLHALWTRHVCSRLRGQRKGPMCSDKIVLNDIASLGYFLNMFHLMWMLHRLVVFLVRTSGSAVLNISSLNWEETGWNDKDVCRWSTHYHHVCWMKCCVLLMAGKKKKL